MTTTNYDWIKPGVKVRIKTKEQIEAIYGSRMPHGLVDEMEQYCGTIRIVDYVSHSSNDRCKLSVQIVGFSWPEGALMPCLSAKGNSY